MLKSSLKTPQSDILSLGLMIIECLEPTTALNGRDTLTRDIWDEGLRGFQVLTRSKTATELLQVRCIIF